MEISGGVIVVADPDPKARARVRGPLNRVGYHVCEAATGDAALELARTERAALVILEVNLPGVSGYEVCRELKDSQSMPVVFLSGSRTEPNDRVAGLLLGADDYMVKPFEPDELLERVRRLIRPTTAGNGGSLGAGLTRRERQVLELLAQGLEGKRIAEELVVSPKTVATHIQRILRKLDVHSRAAAVALAYRTGLVDPGSFI
ncbi:MAG: response regulator transcription factor [Gaiellaceae bacterium]